MGNKIIVFCYPKLNYETVTKLPALTLSLTSLYSHKKDTCILKAFSADTLQSIKCTHDGLNEPATMSGTKMR